MARTHGSEVVEDNFVEMTLHEVKSSCNLKMKMDGAIDANDSTCLMNFHYHSLTMTGPPLLFIIRLSKWIILMLILCYHLAPFHIQYVVYFDESLNTIFNIR